MIILNKYAANARNRFYTRSIRNCSQITDAKQSHNIPRRNGPKRKYRTRRQVLKEKKLVFRLTNSKTFKALPTIKFIW